jgi:adenine-specific DNA-methyltransferase
LPIFIFLTHYFHQNDCMKSQDIEHLKNTIQKARDIDDADRTKLLELLNTFSGYGLVWVDKQEDNENKILNGQMPILKENLDRYIKAQPTPPSLSVPKKEVQATLDFNSEDASENENPLKTDKPAPHHLLIEGDNLPALTALSYTHEGTIDVIYIDPPYNTGNKDFKYNDRFVDKEDPYRHSKWLSFMHKRLLIAKRLLKNTGVIFISIDDNEQAQLKLLCDEVYGEQSFVANVIWQHSIQGKNDVKTISLHHNYTYIYSKSNFEISKLTRTEEHNKAYSNPDEDFNGLWRSGDVRSPNYRVNLCYDIETPSGNIIKPPEKGWRWDKKTLLKKIDTGEIIFTSNETKILRKIYLENQTGRVAESIWFGHDVGTTREGNKELKEVFGEKVPFDTPKPTKLIERILKLSTSETSPSTILDFFAGSGTTLHAVMQLNAEDGGNRQCILVTNNENGIAEEVCYERNKRVIKGYTKLNGTAVQGLTNNHLHYYKMEWFDELAQSPLNLPKGETFKIEHSQIRLARLMREMLMIKENCFEDIEAEILRGYHPDLKYKDDNHPDLDVLESAEKYMVIIYTDDAIADGVHIIEKLPNKEKPVVVYPFEYQGEPDLAPYEHIQQTLTVKALPSSYKETYDHILQDLRKRRRRFIISEEDVESTISAEIT